MRASPPAAEPGHFGTYIHARSSATRPTRGRPQSSRERGACTLRRQPRSIRRARPAQEAEDDIAMHCQAAERIPLDTERPPVPEPFRCRLSCPALQKEIRARWRRPDRICEEASAERRRQARRPLEPQRRAKMARVAHRWSPQRVRRRLHRADQHPRHVEAALHHRCQAAEKLVKRRRCHQTAQSRKSWRRLSYHVTVHSYRCHQHHPFAISSCRNQENQNSSCVGAFRPTSTPS